jgi:transcriptional regulator with XRE-family HTH domain
MSEFRPAKRRVEVSVGESVRIIRELQGLSQNQLSELTSIPQTTISAIENGRVRLGVERAKVLARALKCHPAVLVFPGWDLERQSAAWRQATHSTTVAQSVRQEALDTVKRIRQGARPLTRALSVYWLAARTVPPIDAYQPEAAIRLDRINFRKADIHRRSRPAQSEDYWR